MTWNPDDYHDEAIGPMGLHDAHLLDAICRYVRPRVALEYGGLLGHSLAVMAPHCGFMISVDDNAGEALRATAERVGNARVVKCDMKDYRPDPVPIDLVLFDASHVLDDTIAAYENVERHLSERCLILVHDTGDWPTDGRELPPQWEAWKDNRAKYLIEDRMFVQYLRTYHGYSDITFGTPDHLRHGYTVLSKPHW